MSSSAGTGFQGGKSGGKGGDSAAKARAAQKIKNKLDHLRYKLRKNQTAQVWQSWLRGLVGFLGAQGWGMSHPSWDDDMEKQFPEPQASCKPQQIDPTRRLALVRPGMSGKGPTFMVAEGFYLPANSHEQTAPVVELGSFDGMDVFWHSPTIKSVRNMLAESAVLGQDCTGMLQAPSAITQKACDPALVMKGELGNMIRDGPESSGSTLTPCSGPSLAFSQDPGISGGQYGKGGVPRGAGYAKGGAGKGRGSGRGKPSSGADGGRWARDDYGQWGYQENDYVEYHGPEGDGKASGGYEVKKRGRLDFERIDSSEEESPPPVCPRLCVHDEILEASITNDLRRLKQSQGRVIAYD